MLHMLCHGVSFRLQKIHRFTQAGEMSTREPECIFGVVLPLQAVVHASPSKSKKKWTVLERSQPNCCSSVTGRRNVLFGCRISP